MLLLVKLRGFAFEAQADDGGPCFGTVIVFGPFRLGSLLWFIQV